MKSAIQSVIIAAMLITAQTTVLADQARPGDRVAAKWTDGGFYLATVTAAQSGKIVVLYDDGDKGTVGQAEVKAISRNADFNVGDPVLAAWISARMFPGTVTAKTEFTVTVKWDDGDTPLEVARDRVVLLRREAAVVPQAGALPVGTSVAAKWGSGSFWIAIITSVEANGKYGVKYGDGDKGLVAPGDVLPVSPERVIEVGAHVLACWRGAAMYPGIVTARRENTYTVKWDDGSAPLEVARDRIALLPVR